MNPEFPMRNTTLCYLEQDGKWLMLHRVTKKNDMNHDKWIGVGGKFEPFESPEDCLLREVREETGLQLTRFRCRGIVTFILGRLTEYMHLYTADGWTGEPGPRPQRRGAGMGADGHRRNAAHLGGRQDLLPPAQRGPPVLLPQADL